MATKKKQAEETAPVNNELQQILEHFGENSAEYAEAVAAQNKPSKPKIFVSDEAVEHLIGELSRGIE